MARENNVVWLAYEAAVRSAREAYDAAVPARLVRAVVGLVPKR